MTDSLAADKITLVVVNGVDEIEDLIYPTKASLILFFWHSKDGRSQWQRDLEEAL